MLNLLLVATNINRGEILFNAVASAHSQMSTASISANFNIKDSARTFSGRYELRYRWPNEIRLKQFDSKSQLIHDRTIESDRVFDYDPLLGQYTSAPRSADGGGATALATLDKDLDDLLLGFCDPNAMNVWLEPLKNLKPWSVSSKKNYIEAVFKSDDRSIELSVQKGTGRLLGVDMSAIANQINWNLSYAKTVSGLNFAKPSGATRVPYFDKEMLPPKYSSPEAKLQAMKLFGAYDGLTSLGYIVKRPEGKTTVLISGKFVRQDDDFAKWTYDGMNLVVHAKKTNQWYKQEATFTEVIEHIPTLGTRVDPTMRLLVTGFNPYRKRLGDNATIRVVGSMKLNNEDVQLLSSTSKNATISLAVRQSDGLVVHSISRATGGGELSQETIELSFDYFSVPIDAQAKYRLSIPAGAKSHSFPPIKKTG